MGVVGGVTDCPPPPHPEISTQPAAAIDLSACLRLISHTLEVGFNCHLLLCMFNVSPPTLIAPTREPNRQLRWPTLRILGRGSSGGVAHPGHPPCGFLMHPRSKTQKTAKRGEAGENEASATDCALVISIIRGSYLSSVFRERIAVEVYVQSLPRAGRNRIRIRWGYHKPFYTNIGLGQIKMSGIAPSVLDLTAMMKNDTNSLSANDCASR